MRFGLRSTEKPGHLESRRQKSGSSDSPEMRSISECTRSKLPEAKSASLAPQRRWPTASNFATRLEWTSLEALRDCYRQKKASMNELFEAAKVCRVANVMRPYLESL